MRIGELSDRSGVARSTIRYYDAIGLLGTVERAAGERVFNAGHERRLAFIRVAQEAGFSLAEAQEMLEQRSPSSAWRTLAATKAGEIDRAISDAQRMKKLLTTVAACQCRSLDECAHLNS